MKIQFLNGGLANQAFQYIFCRYYELSHPGDVIYMDDSYFSLHTVHNGYELERVFGIKAHMLSECLTKDVWDFMLSEKANGKSIPQILCENGIETYMISEIENYGNFNPFNGKVYLLPSRQYHPQILDISGNVYYHGYWINPHWFYKYRHILLDDFCFPEITDSKNLDYVQKILGSDSLSVHIRRRDYVSLGWATAPDIYKACAEKILSELPGSWHLFVFSDDIPWCRKHAKELGFDLFEHTTYIEGNMKGENYRDLQLMSMCKAMILSNSAFCYLAALLNTRKKHIINPTDWEVPLL